MNRRRFLKRAVQAAAAASAAAVVGLEVGRERVPDDYVWSWWQKVGGSQWELKTSSHPLDKASLPANTVTFIDYYHYRKRRDSL